MSDRVNFIIEYYVEQRGWTLDNFVISSFNWDELTSFREFNKDIAIAVLTEGNPLDALDVARELNAVAINPYYQTLNKEVVENIQKEGFKVYTYTVNDPDDIDRMKDLGVDGIFSDYPERVK